MNLRFLERTEGLIGKEGIEKLINSKIAVFGLGGVGSSAVEVLIRSGIGKVLLCDYDIVEITNINRQLIATFNSIGKDKVLVQKERIHSINPEVKVITHNVKLTENNVSEFDLITFDYVIDAIDDINAKIALIKYSYENDIRIISSMGTGKRLDPTKFKVADIFETKGCPLARKMRGLLRKENITNLKVVYSEEEVIRCDLDYIPSIAFVPPVAGFIIGGEVIKELVK